MEPAPLTRRLDANPSRVPLWSGYILTMPTLTRRHVLAAGALVLALGAGAGLWVGSWWDQDPAAGLLVLSEDEVAILDALAEAIFPAGGDPAIGGRAAGCGRFTDKVLSGMAETQANLVRLSIHALESLPLATHHARFSALDTPTATQLVRDWLAHPQPEVRGVIQSLYIFLGTAWTTHPEVAPRIVALSTCGYGR